VNLSPPFTIRKLSHVNFYYEDFEKTSKFYIGMLGFKLSDVVDSNSPHPLSSVLGPHPLCFLRLSADHHSSALFPSLLRVRDKRKSTAFQQFSWEVENYDQVRRGADFLKQKNVEFEFVGRRMPASNYNLYFWDCEGNRVEITWGMEQVGWQGKSKPLSFWNNLRMEGKLPEEPVLPDELESDLVLQKLVKLEGQGTKNSVDGYEWLRQKEEEVADWYNVDGVKLPRPFILSKPVYLGVVVQDLERAVNFYIQLLGFKLLGYMGSEKGWLTDEIPRNDRRVAVLSHSKGRPPSLSLCLYSPDIKAELPSQAGKGDLVHAAFEVQTLQQLRNSIEFFEKNNVKIVGSGRVRPRGDYVVDVLDPNGTTIRLTHSNENEKDEDDSPVAGVLWRPGRSL
jgi:catechol 2,3-dioxygenase-like lactoylglutathione lyase family enzyme